MVLPVSYRVDEIDELLLAQVLDELVRLRIVTSGVGKHLQNTEKKYPIYWIFVRMLVSFLVWSNISKILKRSIQITGFFCSNACFMSDHQSFGSLFKVRHVKGCINHDIALGLYSEQLMRLSYYLH